MGQAKPWQVAVVAVGVIVLGISLYFSVFRNGGAEFVSRVYMVDVTTGKLYQFDRPNDRVAISWPAEDPKTKQRVLYKVARDPDTKKWMVNERVLGDLNASKLPIKGLDAKTGLIENQDQSPESIDLLKK
jgi:hypothetical protein